MQDDLRHVAGGAALGALLGALGGWLYGRYRGKRQADSSKDLVPVDRSRMMRLVWSVIGVVRQIVELGG